MLEYLKLNGVGPAPELELQLAPRLNIITGDNGLGKSFLLEIAWWALTRTWTGDPARPRPERGIEPGIQVRFDSKSRPIEYTSKYDYRGQSWPLKRGRPADPGMVIYAQVDGGFSVWDPARNYWRKLQAREYEAPDRPPAYFFQPREVWNGLASEEKVLCNGLIQDWAFWQARNDAAFLQLRQVLEALSPGSHEALSPGALTRISLDDVREMPTLRMPYGLDVPIVHAAAGIKRIVALAYLLVWTWQEHERASKLIAEEPTRRVIFLIDEIEAHLHPRWQRVIVRALLQVMNALAGTADVEVQILAVTHSPLLMASIEPLFDEERDRVFHFDLREGSVVLEEMPWAKRGDAVNWLVSDVFGLQQARSQEAERAIEAAEAFMRKDYKELPEDLRTEEAIHRELCRVLADQDKFWPRWILSNKKVRGTGA
jgi:hypothetical protein